LEEEMNKANKLILIGVIFILLMSACGEKPQVETPGELSGTITISGAFALYPMMTIWGEEFQKIHPEVEFDISGGGAGKGMTDALSGAVDIGMVSRAIKPEEEEQGAYYVGVVKDAVFPVVNAGNPYIDEILAKGLTKETLRKIFISGEITTWGEAIGMPEITEEIHVYTRSDACGAADVWAQYLGGAGQDDLLGIGVNADPGLLAAVINDTLGIGYNNLGYAYDQTTGVPPEGAVVAPIDADEDGTADPDELLPTLAQATEAVASGRYPSPPARVLNLVTDGKPSGLVQEFILWILTEGQELVPIAGYIQLTADQIDEALEKTR
jgi:phosphate transport system substrate-binding protein